MDMEGSSQPDPSDLNGEQQSPKQQQTAQISSKPVTGEEKTATTASPRKKDDEMDTAIDDTEEDPKEVQDDSTVEARMCGQQLCLCLDIDFECLDCWRCWVDTTLRENCGLPFQFQWMVVGVPLPMLQLQ